MRGSPLLRALFAFLAILSLGYPLARLTSTGESVEVAPQPAAPAVAREISLQLTFTTVPRKFRIIHLGKEVWSESAPAAEMERKVTLVFPKEGIDLQFQAEFPGESAQVAMRVKLTDPDGNALEKSLWGAGSIDEVLTFP